jgi:hypothetical protein
MFDRAHRPSWLFMTGDVYLTVYFCLIVLVVKRVVGKILDTERATIEYCPAKQCVPQTKFFFFYVRLTD